jgi:hypothetical protein
VLARRHHWIGVLMAAPLGLFTLTASLGARTTRLFGRRLVWSGVVAGALLIVGAASITGNETTGGPLGGVLVVGYLVTLIWITGCSVRLWRGIS